MPPTEKDAWGESPEDVLLCTVQTEAGHCCLPFGHDEPCIIPPGEAKADA